MTYLASKLISNAYYLSQIVARGNQAVNPSQIEVGLDTLNALLALKSVDTKTIPFYSEYKLTAVPGQEKYFIPGLVEIATFTFNIGSVRYPSQEISRKNYFQTVRADSIRSLPFRWHAERAYEMDGGNEVLGMDLYLYFLPSQAFSLKIWGKFGLSSVSLTTDLLDVYDLSYIEYLRNELAIKLCAEWDQPVTADLHSSLAKIETLMRSANPPDLTPNRVNLYSDKVMLNYAQINIGQGAVPVGT